MKHTLTLRHAIKPSFRVDKVRGMFDVEIDEVSKSIPIDIPIDVANDDWKIGLVVGPSGTGKSTIAKHLAETTDFTLFEGFEWTDAAVVDDFPPMNVGQITEILGKVGFASPPDWLKPYRLLSTGEQMRAELARALITYNELIYDEFTSVVDRQVAQFGCAAVQKWIRTIGARFIAVTCHSDVIEWLSPDWVYDTKGYEFHRRHLRRPPITLEVRQGDKSEWRLFRDYHYLTRDLPRNADNYVGEIAGEPVAWCSIIHFPHPSVPNLRRLCRTVVLPDFQGLGIGGRLSSWVAQRYVDRGYRVTAAMSNPQLYRTRAKDPAWRLTRKGKITSSRSGEMGKRRSSENRLTATFEYVGTRS